MKNLNYIRVHHNAYLVKNMLNFLLLQLKIQCKQFLLILLFNRPGLYLLEFSKTDDLSLHTALPFLKLNVIEYSASFSLS